MLSPVSLLEIVLSYYILFKIKKVRVLTPANTVHWYYAEQPLYRIAVSGCVNCTPGQFNQ